MLLKLNSCAVWGLDGKLIEIEVDINRGQAKFFIVGLTDTAIQESKERIIAAIKNLKLAFPYNQRLTINLAPADFKKEGPSYDLPMALGVALNAAKIEVDFSDSIFVGEISLEGKVRKTNGVLPVTIFAKENGYKKIFVPKENASEAALISGIEIYPVENLYQAFEHFAKGKSIQKYKGEKYTKKILEVSDFNDMSFIKGQQQAKRALEIAVSGMHNIIFSGPPGCGKTLLSRTLPTIMPQMSEQEILEVTKIYSIAGLLDINKPIVFNRPFRSPHHTSSGVSLVGGGRIPKPGEISLAHRGVLFLDEFPEFPKTVLENLRQPLEDGKISISRAAGTLSFPAKIMLVAAQNPCPCGYYGDTLKECVCSASQIIKYKNKISGPILDRIDLHLEVPRVKQEDLVKEQKSESSAEIKKRVEYAVVIQQKRFKECKINYNSEMGPQEVKNFCQLNSQSALLIKDAIQKFQLTARSYYRILKLSRTIADLAGSEDLETEHLLEALQYRFKLESQ